jgi:hypothetical protein
LFVDVSKGQLGEEAEAELEVGWQQGYEQKAKINIDIANKKRNTAAVLRGGLCLQFSPQRRWVFVSTAAAFHQPQQDSFRIAQRS